MTEWGVVGVIIALVGLVAAIAGPMNNNNGSITRLTVAVESFQRSLDKLDNENRESHKVFYDRLDGHDKLLAGHDARLKHLEDERG